MATKAAKAAAKHVVLDQRSPPASVQRHLTHLERSNAPVLVLVHSPGCFHCLAFRDTWNDIVAALSAKTSMSTLDLDASLLDSGSSGLHRNLARSVNGVPYVALLQADGRLDRFQGERTVTAVLEFVVQRLQNQRRV